jgi:hypothetical protein
MSARPEDQTLTSILTNLVQDLATQLHAKIDDLAKVVAELQAAMPTQPCIHQIELKSRVSAVEEGNAKFDADQAKAAEEKRKFWMGICSRVVGTLILGVLVYVWHATISQVREDSADKTSKPVIGK